MTEIHDIPIAEIDEAALPRDRSVIDPAALDELAASILRHGLRLPVELNRAETGYALVSGYRRLMAYRRLEQRHGARFATIPALVRPAESLIDGFARVVEENDIRQGLTPWDRGRTLVVARETGLDTLDAALAKLYPHADRRKRARLRILAEVVEAMDGWIEAPEDWSENRLLRLGAVLRAGWDRLLYAALDDASPGAEWEAMLPLIAEAEALPVEKRNTPDRPRRLAHIKRGLTIRREKTKTGYVLHITGQRATDAVVGEVMEEIERMFEG